MAGVRASDFGLRTSDFSKLRPPHLCRWLLLCTCGLGLQVGLCSDLEVNGNLKVDANAAIGTALGGAVLGVRGQDSTAPLARLVQDLGLYAYPPPPTFNVLEIETHNLFGFAGQSPDFRLLTLTSSGHLGLNTKTPTVPFEVDSRNAVRNQILARFSDSSGRNIFLVPRLGDSGFSWHSAADDAGLFWNDLQDGNVHNSTAGFVIAPQHGGWTGLRIDANGNVGIGTRLTTNPNGYKLAVAGKIGAKEVQVEITSGAWPDYVFDRAYSLMPLNDLDAFVKEHRHLPEVPPQSQVAQAGVNLGEMNTVLLKKVEELTLYVLELKHQNEDLKKRIDDLDLSPTHSPSHNSR